MAAAKKTPVSREAPWRKPNPKAKSKASRTLTPTQKAAAKARAKAVGRAYPNLVDNMAVAKKENAAKAKQ